MLAELDVQTLHKLFQSQSDTLGSNLTGTEYSQLLKELQDVRTRGFASNYEGTEDGISAIAMAIHDSRKVGIAAISVAMPVTRFRKLTDDGLLGVMSTTVREIEIDLESHRIEM